MSDRASFEGLVLLVFRILWERRHPDSDMRCTNEANKLLANAPVSSPKLKLRLKLGTNVQFDDFFSCSLFMSNMQAFFQICQDPWWTIAI